LTLNDSPPVGSIALGESIMNKVATMTLVSAVVISLAGCNSGWPRWMCRGDSCEPACGSGFYEGTELSSGPALLAPSLVPQRPGAVVLPSPETIPSN
jgi:hypothetical protein